METIIYTRQSQDRDGDGLGVARQLEDCEIEAKRRGCNVINRLSDNDLSASGRAKRPDFDKLIAAIEAGKVQAVVAWDMSRLSRNSKDWLRLFEAGKRARLRIIQVSGPEINLGEPMSLAMAEISATIARMEVDLKSTRQARANRQRAQAGQPARGRRAFGYEADGLSIREDEAEVIRDGYAAFLAGVPLAQIARDWNAAGFRAQSSEWRQDSVRAVLMNPRNAGLRGYRPVTESWTTPPELFAAQWPALVPRETYEAAAAILRDPTRRSGPIGAKALLTGIALCGVCDSTIHTGGRSAASRSYRCRGSLGHVGRRAEPVDRYVSSTVVKRLSRPDAIDLLIDYEKPDVEALLAERLALSKRLDSIGAAVGRGDMLPSQVRTANEPILKRIGEIDAAMADAGRVDVLGPLINADNVQAAWDDLGLARQRAAIDAFLIVRVHSPGKGARTFRPETVEVKEKKRQRAAK